MSPVAGRATAWAGNNGVDRLRRLDVPHVGSVLPERAERGPRVGFLIKPTHPNRVPREGVNLLPDFLQWSATPLLPPSCFPDASTWGTQLKSPPPAADLEEGCGAPMTLISALGHGDMVYKVGSSTKITMGRFQRIKTGCRIGDEKYMGLENAYSSEYVFVGVADQTPDNRFGDFGDSGAVVFDGRGAVVGLLFTGHRPHQRQPYGLCLVTPIKEVFEDIKALSKNTVTSVRIAGP